MTGEKDQDRNTDSSNPFVKFKHHVDAHLGAGLQSILGLPSMVTQNFNPEQIVNASNSDAPTSKDNTATYSGPSSAPSSSSPYGTQSSAYPTATGSDGTSSNDNIANSDYDSARIEATLANLSGGLMEEHAFAWTLFLTRSAYSPLILDATLPRGPGPSPDPAFGPAPTPTWAQAFEDLLAASTGLPIADGPDMLLEPQQSSSMTRNPWQTRQFPTGTGTGLGTMRDMLQLSLFFSRLHKRGLGEAYFPVYDPSRGHVSPRTMEEWAAKRRKEGEERKQFVDGIEAMFGRGGDGAWGTGGWDEKMNERRKEWAKKWEWHGKSVWGDHGKDQGGEAQTEEDLYQAVNRTGTDDEDKGLVKSKWSTKSVSSRTENNKTITREVSRDSLGKKVTVREEHVDDSGDVKGTEHIQSFDDKGHVLWTIEREFVRPGGDPSRQIMVRDEKLKEAGEAGNKQKWSKEGSKDKKDGSSWFW